MELEENEFEKSKNLNNLQIKEGEMEEECEKIKILFNAHIDLLKSLLNSKETTVPFYFETISKLGENAKFLKEILEKNKILKKPLASVLQENSLLKKQIMDINYGELFKKSIGFFFVLFSIHFFFFHKVNWIAKSIFFFRQNKVWKCI